MIPAVTAEANNVSTQAAACRHLSGDLDNRVELKELSMEFISPGPSGKGPAEQFTGDVWFDVIYAGKEPSRARTNIVRFSPGARTFWHHHVLGQTLHVVAGIALVGTRDDVVFEALPGETVTCPAGEEHWHGATEDRFMEHLAIWEGDGPGTAETSWLEAVTDAQYHAARTRSS